MVSDTLPPNPWRWVPARVRFGRFEADFETGELRKDGTRIHLQERPFQLLKALIARPGELVTREELRRATYSHHGKPREALEHFQRFQEIFGETPDAVAFLGFAHARSGDVGRAREALESLERLDRRQGVPATDRAIVYIALNERDSAFQWLERAVAARDWHPGFLGVDPLYDSLRTDARFERLLSRVGLPR